MNVNVENTETLHNEKAIEINKKVNIKEICYLVIKRIIDIVCVVIGLIILIPVTIGVYIARKVLKEDDGPIFYEQLRYGKNGKQFRLYKFRSMCTNADKKLKEYLEINPEAKKEFEENQKLQNDPRITKIGKFLRKTSLDELPQVLNILNNSMTIVRTSPCNRRRN